VFDLVQRQRRPFCSSSLHGLYRLRRTEHGERLLGVRRAPRVQHRPHLRRAGAVLVGGALQLALALWLAGPLLGGQLAVGLFLRVTDARGHVLRVRRVAVDHGIRHRRRGLAGLGLEARGDRLGT